MRSLRLYSASRISCCSVILLSITTLNWIKQSNSWEKLLASHCTLLLLRHTRHFVGGLVIGWVSTASRGKTSFLLVVARTLSRWLITLTHHRTTLNVICKASPWIFPSRHSCHRLLGRSGCVLTGHRLIMIIALEELLNRRSLQLLLVSDHLFGICIFPFLICVISVEVIFCRWRHKRWFNLFVV